ncbi:MAG: ABC transporter ATP-binding protein [Polyangiales bacterium]
MTSAYRTPHDAPKSEGPVVVSVRGLVAAYDEEVALRVASLDFRAGLVHGIIGPNGAGKSTLLRAIAGLLPPARGAVTVAGVDLYATPPERWPRVGYMPDNTPVYDKLTAREWLALWARGEGAPGRIEGALRRVGMAAYGARPAGALSLGMRQRLGLARLLVMDAPVALLDEPANGMDPDARAMLGEVLRAEAARGAAVLVSSHVLHELDAVCDRFVVIHRGRLAGEGTPQELAGDESPGALVRVELDGLDADSRERAAAALSLVEGASLVRAEADALLVRTRGGRAARAEVVRALVADGLAVCGVAEERPHIASVYAQLTTPGARP